MQFKLKILLVVTLLNQIIAGTMCGCYANVFYISLVLGTQHLSWQPSMVISQLKCIPFSVSNVESAFHCMRRSFSVSHSVLLFIITFALSSISCATWSYNLQSARLHCMFFPSTFDSSGCLHLFLSCLQCYLTSAYLQRYVSPQWLWRLHWLQYGVDFSEVVWVIGW